MFTMRAYFKTWLGYFQKLEELEKEEEMREKAGFYDNSDEEEDEETKNIRGLAAKIREKKKIMKVKNNIYVINLKNA